MASPTLVATAVSATSPLRQGGFARRGSLYLKTVAATPSHFLFTSASHENEARNLAANLKPFDSIPAVTGGLPFVGSMSRLGDKPAGLEKVSQNVRKLRAEVDTENTGLMRMESKVMNPEGDGRVVWVFHPDDVKAAYGNEGKYPSRGDPFAVIRQWRESRRDIFKNTTGVLTEENEEWQRVRSLIQQDMMRPKSAMFYINQLQDVSRDFVELCRRKRDANGVMQHNHLVDYHNFGIESIALIALDTRLGCLSENTTDENKKAIDSARTIINEMGDLMMGVPMYKLGKWASPRYRKFSNAADDLADFVLSKTRNIAKKTLAKAESGKYKEGNELSVIEKLILKCGPDSDVPYITAFDMIGAGIDTTGNTAAFLTYCLAANPEAQEKLRDEVNQFDSPHVVTENTLNKMKYLKACLKESQRIFPLVLGNSRMISEDMELRGYHIPKKTQIIWSAEIMSMDESNFPEPKKFKPERWLRESRKDIHPFSNLPFSFGPRSCVGRRFAELEIQLLTVKMVQSFQMEWAGERPLDMNWKFIYSPDQPLKFKLTDI